ncbi:MAG: DUF554 domain-containing protein, partial [Anaerovorax sp.]
MLGPIVNALTIIVCTLIGRFLVKDLPERIENIIKKALGLSVIYIGIAGALENQRVMLLIVSMVVGSILGELIDIDKAMNKLGFWAENKMGFKGGTFAKGFVTSTLLFCTGSMAIVGAMQSGLQGNHDMLFAKSILDGVISIVFASTMGLGVAFSAIPILIYEGGIALGAGWVKALLTGEIIREMSA